MNDEQQLLASAYLDDALTDDERARAEADPDVMAAVEQLREIRLALSTVDRPDPARRDAAINAALVTFDAERRPAAPPPVSSLASRRASRWLVGAAAALVLVIAGGILALRGGSDDDDGGAAQSGDAGGAAATTVVGNLLSDTAGGGAEATTGGTAATPEARQDSDDTTAGAAATTGAPGTLAAAAATTTPSNVELPLTPDQFLQYASNLAPVPAADESSPRCQGGQFLGRHVLRIDGKNTRVEIFYNRRAGEYIALNARTCEPLISAPAP